MARSPQPRQSARLTSAAAAAAAAAAGSQERAVFLTSFDWSSGAAAGWDVTLRAYLTAFPPIDWAANAAAGRPLLLLRTAPFGGGFRCAGRLMALCR